MLWNWKNPIPATIKEVVTTAGPKFVNIYQMSFANPPQGIFPSDEAAFYGEIGLSTIDGLNPTIAKWAELLTQHGPLSVTVDAKPGQGWIHALVLTGMTGDGSATGTTVTYVDPADGLTHTLSFADFLKLYEGSANWPMQIIHFP